MPNNIAPPAHNNPLYSFILPSLPLLQLPPLPRIKDQEIYEQVITHVSVKALSRSNAMSLAKPDESSILEKAVDYERLEHTGDAILQSVATGIVHDLYPWLRQGAASIIRNHLVSNIVLSQLSAMYNLPSLIKAGPSTIKYIELSEKMKASVFEAWIAGLFYSFLKQGDGGFLPNIKNEPTLGTSFGKMEEDEQVEVEESNNEWVHKNHVVPVTMANSILQPILKPNKIPTTPKTVRFDLTLDNQDNPSNHTSHLEDLISMMFVPPSTNTTSLSDTSSKTLGGPAPTLSAMELIQPLSILKENSTSIKANPQINPFTADYTTTDSTVNPLTPDLVPTPLSSISSIEPTKLRTKGQAYDHVLSWLTPLLKPYCQWIYSTLLEEQNKILSTSDSPFELPRSFNKEENLKEEDRKSIGMPQALAQHPWMRGNKPIYTKEPKENQRWKVVCKVVDLDGDEWSGEATRGTVQGARNVAAWKVYRQLGQ